MLWDVRSAKGCLRIFDQHNGDTSAGPKSGSIIMLHCYAQCRIWPIVTDVEWSVPSTVNFTSLSVFRNSIEKTDFSSFLI